MLEQFNLRLLVRNWLYTFLDIVLKSIRHVLRSILHGVWIFIILASLVSSIHAQSGLTARLGQAKSPTNTNTQISFVVIATDGQTITVECQQKTSNQSEYQTTTIHQLKSGGDSGSCQTEMTAQAEYQFRIKASNQNQSVVSNTVSIEFTTAAPEPVSKFSKSKSGCQYQIVLEMPTDPRVDSVELYRHDAAETFSLNNQSKVNQSKVNGQNQISFSDNPVNCDQEYYYAARTLDSLGNPSDPVGDLVVSQSTSSQSQPETSNTNQTTSTLNQNNIDADPDPNPSAGPSPEIEPSQEASPSTENQDQVLGLVDQAQAQDDLEVTLTQDSATTTDLTLIIAAGAGLAVVSWGLWFLWRKN